MAGITFTALIIDNLIYLLFEIETAI